MHAIEKIAKNKGATPAQVAIKWVLSVGDHVIPIPGATTADRVRENMAAGLLEFTKDELHELNRFAETAEVKGERYGGGQIKLLWG